MNGTKIRVTLVRSGIGRTRRVKETLKGLGLTRMHRTVELNNTAPIRGMLTKVNDLVRIEA